MAVENEPRDEDQTRGERDDAEGVGLLRFFQETLGVGLLALRLFDELDELGDGGVLREFAHADFQAAGLVHRAAEDGAADRFGYRHGFPCQHGFVERAGALGHDPVERDALARTHDQHIADDQLLDGPEARFAAAPAERLGRAQFHERTERPAGPVDGVGLQYI